MLIEFRVANYRSVAEEQVLSFVPASNQRDYPENVIKCGKYLALNALAIWGANSSGKSNLLYALELFDKMVFRSISSNSTASLPYSPNLLVEGWSEKPTRLEATFVINETRYRYGFSFTATSIHDEWLFRKKTGRETYVFTRQGDTIDTSSGFKGNIKVIDAAIESTRENGLFLSACDAFNLPEAKEIFQWFKHLVAVDGINTQRHELDTIDLMQSENGFKEKVLSYLKGLDLGFVDIRLTRQDIPEGKVAGSPDEFFRRQYIRKHDTQVETRHFRYAQDGKKLEEPFFWPMELHESAGTIKAFHLSGPILFVLAKGGILIVDEIEAKQHTRITEAVIGLFLNPKTNPKQAQLVFATHDTNLLNRTNLRRDQINFVEKDSKEATQIFSLSDYRYFDGNIERQNSDKEKRYLEGRYGATPKISVRELMTTE